MRHRLQLSVSLLVASGVVLLAGCGSKAPLAEDSFYRLAPMTEIERYPVPLLNGNLHVELPRAAGVRRSRALLYSKDPDGLRLHQYHSHHWEEAPAKLLQRRLADTLRTAGIATAVSTDTHKPGDYFLRTELRRFDRLVGPEGTTVAVALDARLGVGRADRWLLDGQYERTIPAASSNMNDTVSAFSRAIDEIVADLIRDTQGVADLEPMGGVAVQ